MHKLCTLEYQTLIISLLNIVNKNGVIHFYIVDFQQTLKMQTK